MPTQLVSTPGEIAALADELRDVPEIALDTEFHGERNYSPRLMLLQLATRDRVVLVDPLGDGDLGALFRSIRDSGALVVGHALRNDLLLLARGSGALPARVFDTQIAAAFLGHGESFGLGNLLRAELGVSTEKAHSMADWERRPLSPALLKYAAEDVLHLLPLLDRLRERLGARAAWAEQETKALLDPALYALPSPDGAWLRVKGIRGRPPRGRDAAILRALAAERERLALAHDVRPGKLLPDEVLLDLMARRPLEARDLAGTHRIRQAGLERHATNWIAAIREGLQASPPADVREPTLSDEQEGLAALCGLLVRHLAGTEGIAPSFLRVNDAVADLVRNPTRDPAEIRRRLGLSGWRAELIGEPLCDLLSGRLRLGAAWRDGQLALAIEKAGAP